jgi:hypothetical protein
MTVVKSRLATVAGLSVALALTALALAWHREQHEVALDAYDRYTLPGYDARVYLAMAEAPAFFTVAPWGLRVAWPWLVHLVAPQPEPRTFLMLTLLLLLLAGGLLYAWLHQLGFRPAAACLGVVAYAWSPAVSVAVRDPFLVDPLALVVLLTTLLALGSAAPLGVIAALLTLGALTKEVLLALLVPTAFLMLRARSGARRGLRDALLCALPALALGALLPRWWTPHITASATPWPSLDVFWLALYRVLAGLPEWGGAALLLGVTPLALLGALRPAARPYLSRYGWLLAATWGLPFVASVYTDDAVNVPFFAADIPRLLLHALPATLPLALYALPGALSTRAAAVPSPGLPLVSVWSRHLGLAGWVATCALLAFPALALEPYRRVDLRGRRDGALLLALCRESLTQARRLTRGRPVIYTLAERRFRPGRDEPRFLGRMRWFLREGWGPTPQYATGAVVMQSSPATLLLPCLHRTAATLDLELRAARPARVRARLERTELGQIEVGPQAERFRLRIPAGAFTPGDNILALEVSTMSPSISVIDASVELIAVRLQSEGNTHSHP